MAEDYVEETSTGMIRTSDIFHKNEDVQEAEINHDLLENAIDPILVNVKKMNHLEPKSKKDSVLQEMKDLKSFHTLLNSPKHFPGPVIRAQPVHCRIYVK